MNDNVVDIGLRVIVEPDFDYDGLWDAMKARKWDRVLVLALGEDGFEWFASDMEREEAFYFMDQVKAKLLAEDALT